MSPFSVVMNLIVAVLLLITLGFGLRLERRLKVLRDSQAGFAQAVAELDRAGSRAEKGLADLRGATEETLELLLGRIDKARELAAKLEALTSHAATLAERTAAPPSARPAVEKAWTRPAASQAEDRAEASVLTLSREAIVSERPPVRREPRATPRSRALVDDDLFELPSRRGQGSPMSRAPRLLPLIAIAIGGVLAIDAIENGPGVVGAVRSFAEDVATPKGAKPPPVPPGASPTSATTAAAAKPAAPICAPTAAELAKEAGLSPAELQVLQSLGDRRGQLDEREQSLDTQVQLIAAAEAKLDGRIQQMNDLKAGIQALLGQADQQQQDETDRLVRVYEAMKPKDAAARVTLLSDAVRLPMAAKMKERALSAILAQMAPDDARSLTEKLADRVTGAQAVAAARTALNPPPPATAAGPKTGPAQAAAAPAAPTDQAAADATAAPKPPAAPKPKRVAKPKPHPKPAVQQAAVTKPTSPASPTAPTTPAAPVKPSTPPPAVSPTASPKAG